MMTDCHETPSGIPVAIRGPAHADAQDSVDKLSRQWQLRAMVQKDQIDVVEHIKAGSRRRPGPFRF